MTTREYDRGFRAASLLYPCFPESTPDFKSGWLDAATGATEQHRADRENIVAAYHQGGGQPDPDLSSGGPSPDRYDDEDLDRCNEPGGHRNGTCYYCDTLEGGR